jgi:hypothetical protein
MKIPCGPSMRHPATGLSASLLARVLALLACMSLGCERAPPVPPATPEPAATRIATGEGIQMAVTLDRERVLTSELITLRVQATFRPGLVLSPPELSGQQELAISDTIRSPPRRRTDGAVEQSWVVSLEPDLPGPAFAPAVKLTVRDTRTGSLSYITTEPIPVEVASVLEASDPIEVTGLRAIPSPPPKGETIWDTMQALIGGATFATLFLIGLGVLAIVAITRRLRPSPITHSRRRINAIIESVETMSDVERLASLSEASRLLRSAIADRASVPALAMTDRELLVACPHLKDVGELDSLLPEIETALCSGLTPDAAATRSLLVRSERALDELSTFVPTRYLDQEGVPA